MGRHYQILIPLLSIFLVRVDLTDLFPMNLKVKVLKIYDGDTVLVQHGSYRWKVRLAKIDAPERHQPFLKYKKDAGLYSRKCLEKLLSKEKPAVLTIEKEDIYGRILGDINEVTYSLIKSGCTGLYPYAVFASKKEKMKYLLALKKAKASRRGLWQYGGYIQPKIWRKISKQSSRLRSRRLPRSQRPYPPERKF